MGLSVEGFTFFGISERYYLFFAFFKELTFGALGYRKIEYIGFKIDLSPM